MFHFLRNRKRQKLLETPLDPQALGQWTEVLDRNIPHSSLLDDDEWDELIRHARVIHAEKRFEGCRGLEVTEEMRITIAGWGALLLLGRDTDYYPRLDAILIYPTSFVVPVDSPAAEGSVAHIRHEEVRIGESIGEGGPGTIVLAWDEVLESAKDWSDGLNVAIHEFTHRLDEEDGALNGTPMIRDRAQRELWNRVFQEEYARLERENEAYERSQARGKRRKKGAEELGSQEPLLDPYALTSPAEFFAVSMETFFEWPLDLEAEHPALYGVIRDYLAQDPAARWRRTEAR